MSIIQLPVVMFTAHGVALAVLPPSAHPPRSGPLGSLGRGPVAL